MRRSVRLHRMFHLSVHRCLFTYACIRPTCFVYISLNICLLSLSLCPVSASRRVSVSLSLSLPVFPLNQVFFNCVRGEDEIHTLPAPHKNKSRLEATPSVRPALG